MQTRKVKEFCKMDQNKKWAVVVVESPQYCRREREVAGRKVGERARIGEEKGGRERGARVHHPSLWASGKAACRVRSSSCLL